MIRPQPEEIAFAVLTLLLLIVMAHAIEPAKPQPVFHVELRPLPSTPFPQLTGDLETPGLYAVHHKEASK